MILNDYLEMNMLIWDNNIKTDITRIIY